MRFVVLGPVAAFDGEREVPLGGPRQRAVLALLLVEPGRALPPERLVEKIWGDEADGALASLYTYVSNLRRLLGADRIRRGPAGYFLDLADGDEVDSLEFGAAVARTRSSFDDASVVAGSLQQALDQWRGRPYEGLEDIPTVAVEMTRLDELRATAGMDRLEAILRSDDNGPVAEATTMRDRRPLDERAWSLVMRSLYRAGRHADALRAAHDFRSLLAEELGLDPSPALIRLEEQILLHDPSLERSLSAGAVSAPTYLTTFVGRSTELERLAAAIDSHRLTTITGPGGVDKTRLAVEFAEITRQRFPHGTWLIDLARVTDPERIAGAIVTAIQVPESGGDPLDGLVRALGGKRVLLILDNAEHLHDSVAEIAVALFARLDLVTMLVTSRTPLGVAGEKLFPIAGLGVGDLDSPRDAERLFLDRCADRSSTPIAAASESVRSICAHLDGMPLALELAASRSSVLTPSEIADLLTRRFAILVDEHQSRDLHRSLEATLGWSYGLLSADDRIAFSMLGVFDGPFTASAAAASIGSGSDEDALDILERLVTSSLVAATTTVDGHTMYRLLETLRAYARDRLADDTRWAEATRRHDHQYLELARTLSDEFLGGGRVEATSRLRASSTTTSPRGIASSPSIRSPYCRRGGHSAMCGSSRDASPKAKRASCNCSRPHRATRPSPAQTCG